MGKLPSLMCVRGCDGVVAGWCPCTAKLADNWQKMRDRIYTVFCQFDKADKIGGGEERVSEENSTAH